jgi:hypothetical protein
VKDFFVSHKEFCFLNDESGRQIESPIVAYSSVPEKKAKFTAIFGVGKAENDGIMGPYYYFTTYENSIKMNKKNYMQFRSANYFSNENGLGLVRFAVFLGDLKHILNYPCDQIDCSEYKENVLKETELELKTLRITDYDGNWTDKYDSIYVGKLELDDKDVIKDAPYWVVKEYEQQCPMSYHYIHKSINIDDCNVLYIK